MQTAEELLSVLQSSYAHSSGQEMQVLNRRLVQLEETLAAERDNVLQLHKNGALLYAQIKNIKVSTDPSSLHFCQLFYHAEHSGCHQKVRIIQHH